MKKVFNFFSKPEEDQNDITNTYRPREPTLRPLPRVRPQPVQPGRRPASGQRPQFPEQSTQQPPANDALPKPEAAAHNAMPTGYADIVEFFRKTVAERRSPYNSLVKAADRLKDFIPNETSRLQAALAICGEQWPADVLSLAISAHISDIEQARKRAQSDAHVHAAERAAALRIEADTLRQQNAALKNEIQSLNERLARLEATLDANNAKLASLDDQIQFAESSANSAGFVDQAAENMKNDLLAKKVILGLP
jgi:flagellar motility protein MotE (MotC chaperone)